MKKLFLFPLFILLVISFILAGCGESAAPTTTLPTTSEPTTTAPTTSAPINTNAPTTTQPTYTGPAAQKTLVVGLITDLTSTLGNQVMNWQMLLTEMYNAKGGVKIGNDTYVVKTICYSTDADFNKGVAAANRLIFQDNVNFIISHGIITADYIAPIAEPEKVITFSNSSVWNSGFLDKWHYNFAVLGQATHEICVAGYMLETYPEMKAPGGLAVALPDNASGHQSASNMMVPYRALGAEPTIVYYPADQRDLSSLGTKIRMLNPPWFISGTGGVEAMGLVSAACYNAGYRGHFFHYLTSDVGLLAPVYKPEVLEGYICGGSAMELEPVYTPWAKEMKDAWIAKFGRWDYADYMTTPLFTALIAAIQKAESIDVEKVNDALHTPGLEFLCPDGKGMMITRPDMRLDGRAVDGVTDNMLKQVKDKKPIIFAQFSPEKALEYVRRAYPALPPGATPTIFKPQ
jgi:ABC-type branched-subunit amino acid transport system substrate-binding protein